MKKFCPTKKQKEALALLALNDKPGARFILFDGGVRSGKTVTLVRYFVNTALQYEGARLLILRRLLKYARQSVWESLKLYLRDYVPGAGEVYKIKEKDMVVEFPVTGSFIRVDGLDNPQRLENIHGTEWFRIWMNEVTQFDFDHFMTLTTRLSQQPRRIRDGKIASEPFARKIVADCNPSTRRHWVYQLCIAGVVPNTHPKRPLPPNARWARIHWSIYDNLDNLPTDIVDTLKSLPPVQRMRAIDGRWITGDNLVFDEFDENLHVIPPLKPDPQWEIYRGIDFGFTNPFCCLWVAYDEKSDVLYVFDELYETGKIVAELAPDIHRRWAGVSWTVCDHDAEDAATLRAHDIKTRPAIKNISASIQLIKDRLRSGRLKICANCVNLIEEMYSYEWDRMKDKPKKENDHAIDALRYVVMELDAGKGGVGLEVIELWAGLQRL